MFAFCYTQTVNYEQTGHHNPIERVTIGGQCRYKCDKEVFNRVSKVISRLL